MTPVGPGVNKREPFCCGKDESKTGAKKKAAQGRGFEFLTGRRQTEWTGATRSNPIKDYS